MDNSLGRKDQSISFPFNQERIFQGEVAKEKKDGNEYHEVDCKIAYKVLYWVSLLNRPLGDMFRQPESVITIAT